MLARLKFKIDDLVNEILDKLPQDIIINGTILDPAIAGGQFVKEVERRKRAAGKTDEEIRATVFGVESNIIRRNYAVNKWKLAGTYVVGNALEMDFDGMRFDVVVGNPPYGETDKKGARKSLSTNLWTKFVDKGIEDLLKSDGYLAMITPASWAGPTKNLSGNRHILKDLLAKYRTFYINLNSNLNDHFPGVGSTFSYYILQKQPSDGTTLIELDGNNSVTVNLAMYNSLPKLNHPLAYSINLKYASKITGDVINGQLQSRVIKYTELLSDKFTYPAYHTPAKGGKIWYTDVAHPNLNDKKIIISLSGHYKPYLDQGTIGFTDMCLAYIVKPTESLDGAYSVLNSNMFKFIMSCNKWSGFNNKQIIRTFALPVLDHVYTDDEVYNYFGLTAEERKFITCYYEEHDNLEMSTE